MSEVTRGKKILSMLNLNTADRDRLETLNNIPRYESTKGTNLDEKVLAIAGFIFGGSPKPVARVSPFSMECMDEEHEPFPDSGSEYVPSSNSSDSESEDVEISVKNLLTFYTNRKSLTSNINKKNHEPATSTPLRVLPATSKKQKVSISPKKTKSITETIPDQKDDTIADWEYFPSLDSFDNKTKDSAIQNLFTLQSNRQSLISFREKENLETNLINNPVCSTSASASTSPSLLTKDRDTSDSFSEIQEAEDITKQKIMIDHAKKNNGKRVRDKVHSCYFCSKLYKNNLPRHYKRVHSDESEIAQILAIADTKKRRERLLNLARCGDFYHNCEVLTMKKGELILARRPSENELLFSTYIDYGPCPQCLGFMLKRHIWHHLKYSCIANRSNSEVVEEVDNKDKRLVVAESTALLNGILSKNFSNEFVLNIINKFKNDKISEICKTDPSIMRYGAFLYEKYSTTQSELIRQSMRQLGRLILDVRQMSNNDITSLSELLCPDKFDTLVSATKQLCISQQEKTYRPEFGIPSLALKLGYSLKKCAAIERGQALRRGDLNKNKKLVSFLTLLKIEWSVRISSNAKATLESRKLNATDLLPLTSDLLKLRNYLDSAIKRTKHAMLQSFTKNCWVDLASLILVRIILFNKRRSGEASKITMQQYVTRCSWDKQGTEEMKNSLTSFERQLASNLTLVQVIGKRGRRVPIILTQEVKETAEQLILARVKTGVDNENPYIFGIPGTSSSHFRGHDCVKKWCMEAELQFPYLITGTKLRKYIATVCQVFDLTENEQDWLARHLGHDIRVHREFYRLQENTVELTKVSRLLLAVEQGEAEKFSGKKLEDINIQDLPAVEEEKIDETEKEMIDDEHVEVNLEKNGNGVESKNEHTSSNSSSNAKINSKGKGKGVSQKISDKDGRSRRFSNKLPWSAEEKEIVLREAKHLIKKNICQEKKCVAGC